jgi:crotonobetainyl-CoA:carnitine CoA-transferase CaiB-like acyl-CoA transferase
VEILKDVKIVAFTQFLLGPASVQYLADLGADVVKVEPPGRGAYERSWSGGGTFVNGVSAFFLLANRNLRSATFDLKHPEGRDAALRLAASADVVVDNFRPGVLERLGLGYEQLKQKRPDLIYACGSGYGSDSPYRDLPGQDLLLQAMSGLAAATGRDGEPPTPAGAAVVDQHAATLLAMGILAALHHRQRTGEGQRVEVTMVQAALDLQLEPLAYHLNKGMVRRPSAPLGSSFHEAPYGIYPTSDGYLAISLSPVATLAEALGNPEELQPYLDRELALSHREEIYRALSPLLRNTPTSELIELLRSHGVWCAPVNDYDAVLADPVITHLDPFLHLDHPQAGPVTLLKHPVRYSAGEPSVRRLPPSIGEHTEDVLHELGYPEDKIAELRAAGIA